MTQTIAFVRKPGFSFARAISSHPGKHIIDIERACFQHHSYVSALKETGIDVITLPALEDCPDAPFVEDTIVVFDHVAVACRNKERSRRGEGKSIHAEIKKYRRLEILPQSVTLDGGDVLNTKEILFIGISGRTNLQAVDALAQFARKPVVPIKVTFGLHLKTVATYLGKNILVLDSPSLKTNALGEFKCIETGESDRYAANCLTIGDTVLISAGSKNLAKKIRKEGFKTLELDVSEFEKVNGGLTCLSVIFKKNTD